MGAAISLVLFDLDGVLCHYDRAARVEHLAASTHRSAEAVRHVIWGTGLESRADAGLIGDEDYLAELGRHLGTTVTLDAWLDARRAAMTLDPEVLRLAQIVSTRRRIAILTNNCRLLALHMDTLCPEVASLFGEAIFATASFGATKPAPQAYLRCLEALGVPAAETFFIDDVEANVTGALDAGLQACEFTSAAALSAELAARGLD
ncbi:HAD family hydrolase [Variovorax sp. GT1P44]|uniref:HAD family hydrolase n=1 Tax=Variovorax sp. GT1P44 TaxID=3443742 RepID=UPI003F47F342